jgi:general secretion pathway protein E/type IV pilus assembly protein PilB
MKGGMVSLRQDGWRKVLMGITTIDEVARTTAGDIS